MIDKTRLVGHYKVEHRDITGRLLAIYEIPNAVVTVGANHILDVEFHGAAASTLWYIGLIDNAGWTAFNSADTLAIHSGWTEATVYSGNRPQWTAGAAATRAITNATTVDFAITSGATLKGIFICNASSGSSGVLWSEAAFSSLVTVNNGDTLKTTYTLSIP